MKIKNGFRYELNGWVYIHIQGKPFERGFAHGYLLAKEIAEALRIIKFSLYDTHGLKMEFFEEVANYLFKHIIDDDFNEILEEIEGITKGANARGANVNLSQILLLNNYSSLEYALPKLKAYIENIPELKKKYGPLLHKLPSATNLIGGNTKETCSAFMAVGDYTKDGKVVCAHNTFENFWDGQLVNIVIDIKPEKGNRILYQAYPGSVWSQTDFFVTSNGFIGTETTIGGFINYTPNHPIGYRMRKCMQYANTLDDYVKMLTDRNSGDYANSWLIADVNKNEIMRIELGLEFVNVERKKNGYFIGFNAPYDARIRNLECINTGFDDVRRHQGARKVRLEQLMEQNKGKLDIPTAQLIIGDHFDIYLDRTNPCSRTCCSHYELDDRAFMSQADRPLPFQPRGAVDGICCSTELAKKMGFSARWGSSCGFPFDVKKFIERNRQWARFEPYLKDRPHQPWTEFTSLERHPYQKYTKSKKPKKDSKKTKSIK